MKPIHLHVERQSLFFLHHKVREEHRHAQTQKDRVHCVADAVYYFRHFFFHYWVERHELLPRNHDSVGEKGASVCLVHSVRQSHSSFDWSGDVSCLAGVHLGVGVVVFVGVDDANLGHTVVSVVLVVLVVVYLKLVVKHICVGFCN